MTEWFECPEHAPTIIHCLGLTNYLTARNRFLGKPTGRQLVKKCMAFDETRWFITVFTSARLLPEQDESISQPSNPVHSRLILILFFHLLLGLPSGLFFSVYPTKTMLAFSSSYGLYAVPILSPWFDHTNNIWWEIQIMKLVIMQFSPSSYCLLPVRTRYLPQHSILQHPRAGLFWG